MSAQIQAFNTAALKAASGTTGSRERLIFFNLLYN